MWLVFRKEIKELVRDRKTLFFMIALPLLVFPVLVGITMYFSGKAVQEAESKVLNYAIQGAQYAPELSDAIAQSGAFALVELPSDVSIEDAVKQEAVDFVLTIPETFNQDILAGGQITITLYLNDAGLNLIQRRLEDILGDFRESYQATAFAQLSLDEKQQKALIEPLVLNKVDVADRRENWGEKIGGLIPYMIFILCLQGAMFPASDLGAGEKERGTLETLLISPIPRHQLVLGKFVTIALAGVVSAMLTVLSMGVWGMVLAQGMAVKAVSEFLGAIGAIDFILMFLMLVPVVVIFASALLSLSIYARSYKESQSYMAPVVFVVIVPVILAMLPGVDLDGVWAWVPLTNVALAIKELIKGTMDYVALVPIFLSTAIIGGAFLTFCVSWFNREKVLFR